MSHADSIPPFGVASDHDSKYGTSEFAREARSHGAVLEPWASPAPHSGTRPDGWPMPTSSRGYSDLLQQRGFASLLIAQALSVFNDNAFKYILSLVVIARATSAAEQSRLVALASAVFVLPYVLFSSYAGQVADRLSKRRAIMIMKALEILLMTLGGLAIWAGHIPAMLAVLFLEGTHSAFLAPAKEGILPQMLPDADLSRANGLLQLTIYTMIVVGPVVAGLVRPWFPG